MTVRQVLRVTRWYLRELTGEAAYERHVERHRRLHPETAPASRCDFERRRTDRQDSNPATRCC